MISLLKPKNNRILNLNSHLIKNYLRNTKKSLSHYDQHFIDHFGEVISTYSYGNTNRFQTYPRPIIFEFERNGEQGEVFLNIWNESKSFKKKISTKKSVVKIFNLIPQQKYFWNIVDKEDKQLSATCSFYIKDTYRIPKFAKISNIRDLGGKTTLDGKKIKYGLCYRGPEFTFNDYGGITYNGLVSPHHIATVSEADIPNLLALDFKVDLDLRGDAESNYINESPLKKYKPDVSYFRIPIDPYHIIFTDIEKMKEKIVRIFEIFAQADKKPVYIHCWGGADRTGTICFLLEVILGVGLTDLVSDYELTYFVGNHVSVKPYIHGLDPEWRKNCNYISMVEEIRKIQKPNETIKETIIRWLVDVVGVSNKSISKIQSIFLE